MEGLLKALEDLLLEKMLPKLVGLWKEFIEKEFIEKVLPIVGKRLAFLFEKAILEKVGIAAALSVIVAAAPIGAILAIHLALRGRRARVFISFQHERESQAETLAGRLASAGIQPVKLPFLEKPDHDRLLDEVAQAIRHCDVFICVPGRNPSFVENEVSMAFGLEKPLLFVVSKEDTPRLPNTAKKGYPILGLERLEDGHFTTLANFCSYLAGDWRSVIRLYQAISPFWLFGFLLLGNVLGLLVIFGIMHPTPPPGGSVLLWLQAILRDPATLCFLVMLVLLFLGIYAYYIRGKFKVRNRVRRTICGQRFDESSLPVVLDGSLTRNDILETLYPDDIEAEHEASPPVAGTN